MLLPFEVIVLVAFASFQPTVNAREFCGGFDGQPDRHALAWIDPSLRDSIHAETDRLQLRGIGCHSYRPILLPLSVNDVLNFERRLVLQTNGWDIRPPNPENVSDRPVSQVLADYFNNRLNVHLVASVDRIKLEPTKTSPQ